MITKRERRFKIKSRVRRKIYGTATRPRLTVFRSNKQIYAQIIDDVEGKTLIASDSTKITDKMTKKEIAAKVGESLGERAIQAGIESVVFDRNGYLYHGRVKELADGARKAGLKF